MAIGTLKVQDVITRVRELLGDKDPGGLQWLDAELLMWFNEGALEVNRLRPESSADTVAKSLVAGTQQTLPADGVAMLMVDYNGTSVTPGRVCRIINRRQLDETQPDWHTQTKKKEVVWVMVSDANPQVFWVYPPNDGTGQLTITYSKLPTKVTAFTDTMPISDSFVAPLVDYICFRAYLKQLESKESQARAADHRKLFENSMGITNQVMMGRTANAANNPVMNPMQQGYN